MPKDVLTFGMIRDFRDKNPPPAKTTGRKSNDFDVRTSVSTSLSTRAVHGRQGRMRLSFSLLFGPRRVNNAA